MSNLYPDRVIGPLTPVWLLWFLFSLTVWKLVLPLVRRLPYSFPLSVLVATGIGYVNSIGPEFSLSRTLVFFPAFLFGHMFANRIPEIVRTHRSRLIAIFIALSLATPLLRDATDVTWLWGSLPYSYLSHQVPEILVRLGTIMVGITMSLGFLAILPTTSYFLNSLGQKTLPLYLLHGLPVLLF